MIKKSNASDWAYIMLHKSTSVDKGVSYIEGKKREKTMDLYAVVLVIDKGSVIS